MISYSLTELNDKIVTSGFNDLIGREFCIRKGDYSQSDVRLVTDDIFNYLTVEKRKINDRETYGFGSWMLQFVFNEMYIEVHELKDVVDGENVYGFDLTLSITFFRSQTELCFFKNVSPNIPLIGQKIVISREIYHGAEVNAVRYPSRDHMTGWFLTSNTYNGDINSLLVDHLYHLLKARPELAKFLGLPPGFRFYKDKDEEEIWIDSEI